MSRTTLWSRFLHVNRTILVIKYTRWENSNQIANFNRLTRKGVRIHVLLCHIYLYISYMYLISEQNLRYKLAILLLQVNISLKSTLFLQQFSALFFSLYGVSMLIYWNYFFHNMKHGNKITRTNDFLKTTWNIPFLSIFF